MINAEFCLMLPIKKTSISFKLKLPKMDKKSLLLDAKYIETVILDITNQNFVLIIGEKKTKK